LPTTALRFTNVYGPYSYHKGSVVALFMKQIMEGEPLVVYGDGGQTRDFLYVDDLCTAVLAAIERKPMGELYQLGTGTETSVNELVAELRALFPDRELAIRHEPSRAGEIARAFSDISKARKGLGYDPVVGLSEGLARTRDWFVGASPA
jgi:UDP-glucose 4-epimerase